MRYLGVMSRLPSVLLRGSTALLLAVLAGCGGRTTFEPADFGPAAPSPADSTSSGGSGAVTSSGGSMAVTSSGGSVAVTSSGGDGFFSMGKPATSTGGSASGGARSFGAGGTAVIAGWGGVAGYGIAGWGGVAGYGTDVGMSFVPWGGTGSLDPEVLTDNCDGFCKADITSACPTMSSFAECKKQCISELASRSPQCQFVGIDLLGCLYGVYQNNDCSNNFDQLARARCAGDQDAYQRCIATSTAPGPTCGTSGHFDDNGNCTLLAKCGDGAHYNVSCSLTSSFKSDCSCSAVFADGTSTTVGFTLVERSTAACENTLAACGFPGLGLK
jgi:hypothetical protein